MAAPRGTNTTLAVGLIRAPIKLVKNAEKRNRQSFEEGSPDGNPVTRKDVPVEGEAAELSDPLGVATPEQREAKRAEVKDALAKVEDAKAALDKVNPDGPTPEPETESKIVDTVTGEFVEKDDLRRGLFRESLIPDEADKFLDLTPQLDAIDAETKLERMEILGFIPTADVPRERVRASYFVCPNGPGAARATEVLMKSMRSTKRVGLVKWTKTSRQSLGVVVARGKGKNAHLEVLECAWAAELREVPEEALVEGAGGTKDEVAAFEAMIDAMKIGPEVMNEQDDDSITLYAELAEKALAGEELPAAIEVTNDKQPEKPLSELATESMKAAA